MKFVFRTQALPCAFEAQKQSVDFRSVASHAANVMDATERFLRDQLLRKREKLFNSPKD
jgi:hypothetical protein